MTRVSQYYNCRLLRGYELVRDELWVKDGRIISPDDATKADEVIDCRNAIICPGFIDLQVNGAFGVDFLTYPGDLSEGIRKVNCSMPKTGVTAYCPTLITSPPEYFHKTLPQIAITDGNPETKEAAVLGVHCEGPFISLEKKGAHPPECITDYQGKGFEMVKSMYGHLNNIKIITLGPEYEQSLEVIRELVKRGVVVSLGHSVTSLERAVEAVVAGATMITHLFNAMPAFHHRDPSLPGLLASEAEVSMAIAAEAAKAANEGTRIAAAAAAEETRRAVAAAEDNREPAAPAIPVSYTPSPDKRQIYFGLIADGIHTHETALRLAYRLNPDGLVLVTDALAPMGLPCGDYKLGKQPITVQGEPKRATVKGTNTLCGCVATMDFCVRHFLQAVGCPTGYALAAATLHPARCMGIHHKKGTLNPGSDADFILLDDNLNILRTYIAGTCVFRSSE